MLDVVMNMARPYAAQANWSDQALETWVRAKLPDCPTDFEGDTRVTKAYAKAVWVRDHICTAILRASGW